MKHKFLSALFVIVVFVLSPLISIAETFPMPKLPDHEVKKFKIHYEGKKLDMKTASLGQRLLFYDAPRQIDSVQEFKGKGAKRHLELVLVEQLNCKNIATNTFIFKPSTKSLILNSYERTVKTPAGKQLRKEMYNFSNPFNEFAADLMHPYTVETAFRGLPLDKPGSKHRFHIWLPPALVIPMEVKVKSIEKVKLPGGTRKAVRLDMTPDMSEFIGPILGRLIQPILPKWQFWFETHGTHPIVKYKGPLGKVNVIGVPDEVYTMLKLDPDPAPK